MVICSGKKGNRCFSDFNSFPIFTHKRELMSLYSIFIGLASALSIGLSAFGKPVRYARLMTEATAVSGENPLLVDRREQQPKS